MVCNKEVNAPEISKEGYLQVCEVCQESNLGGDGALNPVCS